MEITINDVQILDEPDELKAIFFGENSSNRYFQIQDAYSYDEQDVRLGMDCYYIERDDQLFSCYGGIDEIQVSEKELRIYLTSKGVKMLQVKTIVIKFEKTRFEKTINSLTELIQKHHSIKTNI